MLSLTLALSLAVVSAQARGAVPRDEVLAEIYDAAQIKSGTLTVIFGGSLTQAAAQPMIDAFQSQFPLVPINITVELSKYVDSIIDRSYMEGMTLTPPPNVIPSSELLNFFVRPEERRFQRWIRTGERIALGSQWDLGSNYVRHHEEVDNHLWEKAQIQLIKRGLAGVTGSILQSRGR